MKQEKKKKTDGKFGVLMILLVTAILLLTIALTDSPEDVLATIRAANPLWLLVAVGFYLLHWSIDSWALHQLILKVGTSKYLFVESVKTAITGTFFSNLTPSASGGQPMQILRMKKHGIPVGRGTAIMTIRFIVFQSAAALSGIALLIMRYGYFQTRVSNFRILAIVGLVVNVTAGALLLLASIYPKLAHWVARAITRVLAKIKLIRRREDALEKVDQVMADFAQWPKLIKGDKKLIAGQIIATFLQMTSYYSTVYFVFKAIGAPTADYILVLTAAACVWLAASFVPLPGGSGGTEGMFVLFFSTIFVDSSVGVALLLWRFVTFYLPIFIGGVMLFYENRQSLKVGKGLAKTPKS
ncbi:MAG: lysylphosphatidylglycerol synthase transmembrane domain-containing protein [Candidatus Nanosyncoccaceae bacterium]|jgi:uncharacterized protein (TIRG00374 family)